MCLSKVNKDMNSSSNKIADELRKFCDSKNYQVVEEREIEYGLQLKISDGSEQIPINVYHGRRGTKVVVGGEKGRLKEDLIRFDNSEGGERFARETDGLRGVYRQAEEQLDIFEGGDGPHSSRLTSWIGTDEAGKGDYFGPLSVAGVYVDENAARLLLRENVGDSKRLFSGRIEKLSEVIKSECVYSSLMLEPEVYNRRYQKLGNLNRLLGWGHAKVIENILKQTPSKYALVDKFGSEKHVIVALGEKGKKLNLVQKPKAEDNIAVAAASIVARAEYLAWMRLASSEYRIDIPGGASKEVIEAGKIFIEKYGKDVLGKIAKLHFKTTKEIG